MSRKGGLKKRVLLDCDPGIDDALAIIAACAFDNLQIEAITTVYGNTGLRQATANLKKILGLLGPGRVPEIGAGSKAPLVKKRPGSRGVHGKDGLGEAGIVKDAVKMGVRDGIKLGRSLIASGRVNTIIATGPLTNVAKMLSGPPEAARGIERIYIMGGALFAEGNMTPHAEFNFYNDPEAAAEVLGSRVPKTLVSLDVTRKAALTPGDLRRLRGPEGPLRRFITGIAGYSARYNARFRGIKGASLHDPLCAAIASEQGLCAYGRAGFSVTLDGDERGRVKLSGKTRQRDFYCRDVDIKTFKDMFLEALNRMIEEDKN